MVHVQSWVPFKKKKHNDVKLYRGCWEGKWKCNLLDPMQWVDIVFIMFSFPTKKNTTMNNILTINDMHVS
jgi:hypothetical protein